MTSRRPVFPIIFSTLLIPLAATAPGYLLQAQTVGDSIIDSVLPNPRAPCTGELEKRWPRQPWDFTTNSRRPNSAAPTTFLHCVHNNGNNVVDVNWCVPLMAQPIPPNESVLSPRYSSGPPIGNVDGCLVYGNLLNNSVRAEYWARSEDRGAIGGDREPCCQSRTTQLVDRPSGPSNKLQEIIAPFRIFLPANPGLNANVVAFEGVTGVKVFSSNNYESFVTYRLRSSNDNSRLKGLPDYVIAPQWSGDVANLIGAFKEAGNETVIPLQVPDPTASIRFKVNGSEPWRLQELKYELRNRNFDLRDPKGVVGTFFTPAFVPER